MKFRKILSLAASAAIVTASVTTAVVPAMADTAPASVTLFSDDFDTGYTNGVISKHDSDNYTNLTGTEFKLSNGIGINDDKKYFYPEKMNGLGSADRAFVLEENAGVGTGKALNVTTQAGLGSSSWMIKNSGITTDSINGKTLTFTANIMIPAENGFNKGNGVMVYLDTFDAGKTTPTTNTSYGVGNHFFHYEGPGNNNAGNNLWNKTLLGIEAWNWWTSDPCIIAFGEKVQNIKPGVQYSYELTLTPDADGKYTAKAAVNGTTYDLAGTYIPKVAEMSGYNFAMVAEKANPYNIQSCYTTENKYQNDKTIALLDDLKLAASAPPKSDAAPTDEELGAYKLIDEGFEDYTEDYVIQAAENNNKQYEKNSFILNNGASSTSIFYGDAAADNEKLEAGDITKLGKISNVVGTFGSGNKYLNIQSQAIVQSATMWQRSNITPERIANKTLVFKTKFMIPSDSQWGRGFGAAVVLSGAENGILPQGPAGSYNLSVDRAVNCKHRLATIIGEYESTQFQVFGENVGEVSKGTPYDVTVTMVPKNDGTYTVTAQLNDITKTLTGKKTYDKNEVDTIPTREELGSYSFVGVTSHTHKYFVLQNFTAENKYQPNKDLIYFDDISLKRANKFTLESTGDLTSGGTIDMAKKYITLGFGEAVESVDKSKIIIDNGAIVESAEIDAADNKKVKITFGGLKRSTAYTIKLAGIVNPIGIEYTGELSLGTSSGVDVNYDNITFADGKVTVPVAKNSAVSGTVKPAVIVCVYDGSVTGAPLAKKAYVKEQEITSETYTNIEVTEIKTEPGDKVRVFVWDGLSTMNPLAQSKDFNN